MVAGFSSSGKYKETNPSDADKRENKFSSQMGVLVGGLLFGGTLYLDRSMIYGHALQEVKKNTGKDKKSTLLRERLAEEALERPAKIANMISNISVWSTLILAAYIEAHSEQGLQNYAGLAMGLSMLPWMIENRMVRNWEKHQEYKRKIYAPITTLDLTIDPHTKQPLPLLGMRWQF
jgi:hypothetical protein